MNCPNCGQSTGSTPMEQASHACPTDKTDLGFLIAAEHAKKAQLERAAIRPTKEKLMHDLVKLAQYVNQCWDGEVDIVMALCPKGTGEVTYITTAPKRDRLVHIVDAVKKNSSTLKFVGDH